MRRLALATLPCLLLALSACSDSSSGGGDSLATFNSGLAVSSNHDLTIMGFGDFIYVLVNELEQNQTDLNGDGDIGDDVVHSINVLTQEIVNLGISAAHASSDQIHFASNDTHVAWIVSESDQGNTDYSMDGDFGDHVVCIYDPNSPVSATNPNITSTDVFRDGHIFGSGSYFAFTTSELNTGVDLNGDGTTSAEDIVVRTINSGTLAVTNAGLSLDLDKTTVTPDIQKDGVFAYAFGSEVVVMVVSELLQGGMNLNNNGVDADSDDLVGYGHDAATGTTFALGAAGIPRAIDPDSIIAVPGFLGYTVDEENEGVNVNMNGIDNDADIGDHVFALISTGAVNTETFPGGGISVQPARTRASTTRVVVSASEVESGLADFNSDGDSVDFVPFWIDLADPTMIRNIGIAQDGAGVSDPVLCNNVLVMLASETAAGFSGTNFNGIFGDSDAVDQVAFHVVLEVGGSTPANLGVAATQILCASNNDEFVTVVASEAENGEFDIDDDGSADDDAILYYQMINGQPNLQYSLVSSDGSTNATIFECADQVRVISYVAESTLVDVDDPNDDDDNDDFVVMTCIVAKANGGVTEPNYFGTVHPDVGDSEFPVAAMRNTVVFPTLESSLSLGRNLNQDSGDGDTGDTVLHFATFDCP